MIRLIVSDMDDTLLRSDATLSPRTEKALSDARALGAEVVLASGRMVRAMMPYARQLAVTAPMIACNGALVVDPKSGEESFSLPVPASLARKVCLMAESRGLHVQAYFGDNYYFEADNRFSELYAAAINLRGVAAGRKLSEFVDQDCVKLLVIDEPETITRVVPEFAAAFAPELSCAISRPRYIEITSAKATKGNALRELAGRMGVPLSEIAAFGDGQNDLSMLNIVGYGCAPGNAREEVRARAAHVSPSNDEDGVAVCLEELMAKGMIGGRA